MGNTLYNLGRYEEALKACERVIEIKSDFADAWYNRACIYSIALHKEEALYSLKRAIELDEQFRKVAV